MEIIQRGAEAVLYLDHVDGQNVLVKERVKKGYRIVPLDEKIRSQRTRREVKLITTAGENNINVPRSRTEDKYKIVMDFVDGKKVKDVLNKLPKPKQANVCKQMSDITVKLHESGIIHGDLTTSNFIMDKKGKIFVIDFGLGKFSKKIEDQAVDLFLLYEALKSTHYENLDFLWRVVLNTYENYERSNEVFTRFDQIKKRRRYAGD